MFSQNQNAKNGKINGVHCTVASCSHHGTGNCCTAADITVGTEYSHEKAETFCATFEQLPGQ